MAELDVNEGIVPLIEMRFPPPGTLLTPVFPAPTNARTFVILRLLGVLAGVVAKAVDGRMPADQETIRYTGVYGDDLDGRPYLMREVLGGGSGGRYYADGEDTIHVVPTRGTCRPSSPRRGSRSASSRSAWRWTPAARASSAAGSATRSTSGCSRTPLHVDRGPVDPGLLGRQGRPGRQAVPGHHRPGGPNEREVDALADAEPVGPAR
jgi:N-methylhydantoinase B